MADEDFWEKMARSAKNLKDGDVMLGANVYHGYAERDLGNYFYDSRMYEVYKAEAETRGLDVREPQQVVVKNSS